MKKYRLTLLFVMTAVVAIAIATVVVNRAIGNLVENNLIRIAEENTARDAEHIQATMRREHPMHGVLSADGNAMQGIEQPLTLAVLTGPEGLSSTSPTLVVGLNVVKFNLFDLNGTTVWSTDPKAIGIPNHESPLLGKVVTGEVSSKFIKGHEVVHLDGVTRSIDVVETYLR